MVSCLWRVQSYNLKAIHNNSLNHAKVRPPVCEGCKVTIWKQFTTNADPNYWNPDLFVKGAKLQFESNSQQELGAVVCKPSCLWRVQSYNLKAIHNQFGGHQVAAKPVCEGCKVTIWKQFTTCQPQGQRAKHLFVKGAKLQFESNSQQGRIALFGPSPCLWRVQSYNLKAIHNQR